MTIAKSKYESWLARTMNNPALNWARPQATRRLLVLAMIALALSFAVVMWAAPSIWWFAPLMIVFIPLMGSLNGSIRGLSELRQHQLDEREGRARDAAYRIVFWPVVFMVAVGTMAMGLSSLTPELRAGFAMTTFILVLTMPTLYLAWTLPDDPNEDS